jgi:hypothetical protein
LAICQKSLKNGTISQSKKNNSNEIVKWQLAIDFKVRERRRAHANTSESFFSTIVSCSQKRKQVLLDRSLNF